MGYTVKNDVLDWSRKILIIRKNDTNCDKQLWELNLSYATNYKNATFQNEYLNTNFKHRF